MTLQKTRVIVLSCGIVWFCHTARVWQTDRITTPKIALALLRRMVKNENNNYFQNKNGIRTEIIFGK